MQKNEFVIFVGRLFLMLTSKCYKASAYRSVFLRKVRIDIFSSSLVHSDNTKSYHRQQFGIARHHLVVGSAPNVVMIRWNANSSGHW